MASTSQFFEAKVLMAKGRRATAAYIHADCSNSSCPLHLNVLLDNLLNPVKSINDWETIDWCKWLMAGGRTPDEFASTVRAYDNATTCGLVWTPNFVAYRCRTCGISPCMSLCTECFKKGNHQRHDFNMFLSQAGGACDCGDTSVMKETGFCDRHGPNKTSNHGKQVPHDLMCVAEAMMPRIIFRLILHLREHYFSYLEDQQQNVIIQDTDSYITMLLDFNNMGGLMRRVMTTALTNPQKYRVLNELPEFTTTEYASYLNESHQTYLKALDSITIPEEFDEYKICSLSLNLVHKTFLEELVFWTVMYEFPQKIVCLLLNMLPDPDYKEALTRAFVLHYSRISMMLERSNDPDTLSNRVVHVSVQLFSNLSLALRMTEQLNLLQVMVVSLNNMMSKILIKSGLHEQNNLHNVVDCSKRVMKDHCYWPLVSDLNNVLSHRPVALKFMGDDALVEIWFAFLSLFQGMNVNQREVNQHIEFEPNTYYAAFSAELEASAYPMWALVAHLTDESTADLTKKVLAICLKELRTWLNGIHFCEPNMNDDLQVSFHLPLHRYFAVFLCQAVAKQNISLNDVLPPKEDLYLMIMHPLRIQVAFYEILNGLWVRNGLQIKGQAMTYIQCNFCNSMVDADLYLLQVACTRMNPNEFISIVADKFRVGQWLTLTPSKEPSTEYVGGEQDSAMMESFLTFLATLVTVRTNIGLSEADLNRLEMITLLCIHDKTHSQLMELMPERCGTSQSRHFESLLAEVADYRAPGCEASGNLQQGMYSPKTQIWEQYYDPIHVLLRAVHRRDFQTSMDHYTNYVRQTNKIGSEINPWPPFRNPTPCSPSYDDPRQILRSRHLHALLLAILYKAVEGGISEHVIALTIFLLDQAISITDRRDEHELCHGQNRAPLDMNFANWFNSDCIFHNLPTIINKIVVTPEPEVTPRATYSSGESDVDWENSETDTEMTDLNNMGQSETLMLPEVQWPQAETGTDLIVFVPPNESDTDVTMYDSPIEMFDTASEITMAIAEQPGPSVTLPQLSIAMNQRLALLSGNEVGRTVPISTDTELVPSTSGHRLKLYRRRPPLEAGSGSQPVVKINESIISLLLKLHSNLAGVPDSFNPEEELAEGATSQSESLIGDGTFFIGRLLRKIASLDGTCRRAIVETRLKLWPTQEERDEAKRQRENREERRRRAKERQQKLMAEFASKQKQFMEKTMETEEGRNSDEEMLVSKQEYDCVICNQSSPSTEDSPMGLVVLVQASSVIGHRRRFGQPERSVLPTCDEEKEQLRRDDTLAMEFDRRLEEFDRHFDAKSWYLSVNIGWDGGVHVQTCGHHLHLSCLNSYLNSLRSQQRQVNLSPEKGEYYCPLCRQLANSVLPLASQLGERAQMVRSNPSTMSQILDEISDFLRENDQKPSCSQMAEAIGKIMEVMTSSTQIKSTLRARNVFSIPESLFLFVTSIARTNLELELIQHGGTLVSNSEPPNPLLPKRDCIVPLLHVLSVHARVTRHLAMWPAWMTFQQLCGLPVKPPSDTALAPIENEIPLMLKDPVALLLQFVLLLPLHLDQNYFCTIVQMVYNLLYYQVVAQVSCGLTSEERARITSGIKETKITTLTGALALINQCLGHTDLYMEDDGAGTSSKSSVNLVAIEQQVQKLCLPFLRIAALLKYHIYNQTLPDIANSETEFVCLVHYLELVQETIDWECFNGAVALNWPNDTKMSISSPQAWCNQFGVFVNKSQIAARSLLVDQHITWHPPRLLQLPREYEKIFTYYHERLCSNCHSVPNETSICLLCGTIVCLKQGCCKHQNICEATAHAAECGAGTGVFLVVTSTYIIVMRGHRACLWGSLYLDDFEEEDRDLKRGKPLYLSKDRYQLLEQQWLAHRFDHTKKTWVQHRNAL